MTAAFATQILRRKTDLGIYGPDELGNSAVTNIIEVFFMKPLKQKLFWIPGLICTYIVAYFALMARDVPVWKNGQMAFRSSFLFADVGESAPGPVSLSMCDRAVSTWNYVFLPADWCFYSLAEEEFVNSRAGNYIRDNSQ